MHWESVRRKWDSCPTKHALVRNGEAIVDSMLNPLRDGMAVVVRIESSIHACNVH